MKIGIDDYKKGQKNTWRRQCWNEIAKRVKDRKNAIVLYLPAEQDMDRRVAVSKGFSPDNMIAVDMREEVVEKLREENKLTICGRIEYAMFYVKPKVIHMDLCSGFKQDLFVLLWSFIAGRYADFDSVFCINMMRGREHSESGQMLKIMQAGVENSLSPYVGVLADPIKWHRMHRGFCLYCWLLWAVKDGLIGRMGFVDGSDKIKKQIEAIGEKLNPFFCSYASTAGNLIFDTVIFDNPLKGTKTDLEPKKFINEEKGAWLLDKHRRSFTRIKSQVSAVKAVQTMRKNGKLPACAGW